MYKERDTSFFPSDVCAPAIGQVANAVMEGFMNCSHASYREEQTDYYTNARNVEG